MFLCHFTAASWRSAESCTSTSDSEVSQERFPSTVCFILRKGSSALLSSLGRTLGFLSLSLPLSSSAFSLSQSRKASQAPLKMRRSCLAILTCFAQIQTLSSWTSFTRTWSRIRLGWVKVPFQGLQMRISTTSLSTFLAALTGVWIWGFSVVASAKRHRWKTDISQQTYYIFLKRLECACAARVHSNQPPVQCSYRLLFNLTVLERGRILVGSRSHIPNNQKKRAYIFIQKLFWLIFRE